LDFFPTASAVVELAPDTQVLGARELGHVEGKTFVVEARYGDGRSERLPELARELVDLKPDVIVTSTDVATAAVNRLLTKSTQGDFVERAAAGLP